MSVRLGAEISDFQRKMNAVSKQFAGVIKAGEQMKSVGQSLSTYVSAPMALLAGASLKAAGSLQALERGFEATFKEAGSMTDALSKVQEVAKLPGLGLKEAIQGATNLQAVGFAAEQSRDILKGFGNALATVGKGKSELDGVITALSQMAAKGKISAEEINQIAERVPQIRKVMKDAFGTADTEVLQKMGISVDQFVAKVTTELGKLPKVTGGINNAFENMGDAGFLALSKIGDGLNKSFDIEGKMAAIGDALSAVADRFGKLDPFVQKTIFVVGALVAATGPLLLALGSIVSIMPVLGAAVASGFGLISGPIGIAIASLVGVTALFSGGLAALSRSLDISARVSNDATEAYKKQKTETDNLSNSINPLLKRYEELKGKANLNKVEQKELSSIIAQVGKVIPGAVSAYNSLGAAIGLNTTAAREFLATQQKITEIKNTDALKEQRQNYAALEKQIRTTRAYIEGANRFINAPNPGNDQYIALQKERRREELYTYNASLAQLLEQRKGVGAYIMELKGIAPVFEEIAAAASGSGSSGVTDAMTKALQDLNKELYLNGQYSKGLGDSYAFVDERRGILESGLKSLMAAGFAPGSEAVKKFKAELDKLPQAIDLMKPSFENTIPSWSKYLQNFAETGRFVVNDLKAGFDALTGSVQKMTIGSIPSMEEFKTAATTLNEVVSAQLQSAALNVASNTLEMIGSIAVGAASFGDLGKMLLGSLADLAIDLGTYAISIGLGIAAIKTAFDSMLPGPALAAGAALLILGGATKGILSKMGKGAGKGTTASSYSPPTASTGGRAASFAPGNTQAMKVEFVIQGTNLVGVLKKETNQQVRRS